MNNEHYAAADDRFATLGWTYNSHEERFEVAAGPDAGKPVDWEQVIAAVPYLSDDELTVWCEGRAARRSARQGTSQARPQN